MSSSSIVAEQIPNLDQEALRLYGRESAELHRWTDRLFAVLLLLQWIAGIVLALVYSPRTWTGAASEIHPHLWAAVILGGMISVFPVCLVLLRPGAALTRFVIAVAQMLWSALLIHLTDGRIESHFHVFGSLAFLAFYRDWRVLVTATVVVVADHGLRGFFWPQSVYGLTGSVLGRTLEHGFWVLFEDAFLLLSIRNGEKQAWGIATRQAELQQLHSGEIQAKEAALRHSNGLLEQTNQFLNTQINERNQAIETLRVSEERYRRIVEFSPVAMLLVQNEQVLFVNRPCLDLFGSERAEGIVGRGLSDLFDAKCRQWITELRHSDKPYDTLESYESKALCLDGSIKEVEVSVFFSRSGEETNMQVILHDVSQRKQQDAQHRQAQKLEATGQLAGGIAHDFNNLLAVILGSCQFLEKDANLTDDGHELVGDIFKAGNRAAALTKQLLAYSRQQVLQSSVVNINEIVIETGTMLERVIGEDIVLMSRLDPDLSTVKVDAGQIQQVIMNLAVNARDAMPQGGKLTIETTNVELVDEEVEPYPDVTPGPYVALTVSDTGCGMDEAVKASMFEPFFTTKGVGKGTGLGLATVFGIVKQSNGHIVVESEPNQGATFTVYLPIVESKVTESIEHDSSEPAFGDETILVVEDEDAVRNLAGRILRAQGYTVVEARNGCHALEILNQFANDIHLVLTDVVMPEMGGRQLHERLIASRPSLPVLFMSGYTDDAIMRHGVLEDEKNFIAKPFTYAALSNEVRRVLDEAATEVREIDIADQLLT